jgi:hypothetical protein
MKNKLGKKSLLSVNTAVTGETAEVAPPNDGNLNTVYE